MIVRTARIARIARLERLAKVAITEARAGGAVRLPLGLAEKVATFLAAAEDVAAAARAELVVLESTRDPDGTDPAPRAE